MLSLVDLTAGTKHYTDNRFVARKRAGSKETDLMIITRSTSSGAGGGFHSVYGFCGIPVVICKSGSALKRTVKGRFHTSLTVLSRKFTGKVLGRLGSHA